MAKTSDKHRQTCTCAQCKSDNPMILSGQRAWIQEHQTGTWTVGNSKMPEFHFAIVDGIRNKRISTPRKWSRFTHNLTKSPRDLA